MLITILIVMTVMNAYLNILILKKINKWGVQMAKIVKIRNVILVKKNTLTLLEMDYANFKKNAIEHFVLINTLS